MADYNTVKANVAKSAAKGQTYGKAAEQLAGQSVVPMGPSPTGTPGLAVPKSKLKNPGVFLRSTEDPNEPITAGLDVGPGVTAAGAGIPMGLPRDNALEEIKQILQFYPNDDLFDLVSRYGGN